MPSWNSKLKHPPPSISLKLYQQQVVLRNHNYNYLNILSFLTCLFFADGTPTAHWKTGFKDLFNSQLGADISFVVNGRGMKAHKAILSAKSPVFSIMLPSKMKEKDMGQIPIPEIYSDIFYCLLRFLYTEQVELM